MDVSETLSKELISQAILGGGDEVCGLVTRRGIVRPMVNVAADPRSYFEMDSLALIQAYAEVGLTGDKVVGVYHSHPHGPCEWSRRDVRYFVPNLVNLLIAPVGETDWRILSEFGSRETPVSLSRG